MTLSFPTRRCAELKGKFYFRPGKPGFKVWKTRYGTFGVGICWGQWYPETARAMMLMGADILFFPTAIGNEPHDPDLDTSRMWQRAMVGHSVSNVVPVVAANRIGRSEEHTSELQSLMRISYAVFCLNKKKQTHH